MPKKKTKKKDPGGRPARNQSVADCRVEIRCTAAELKRYDALAKRLSGGDRAKLFRFAVDQYAEVNAARRAPKKVKRTGAAAADLVWILVVAGFLMMSRGCA